MKSKLSILILFLFLSANTFAQSSNASAWKELKEFHTVMAATFHPSEKNDLAPVKARAGELNQKAVALSKSTPPKELDTPKIHESIAKLQQQTVALEKMIQQKDSDENIKKHLSTVHDTFHEIMGMCMHDEHDKGEKKEEHHD